MFIVVFYGNEIAAVERLDNKEEVMRAGGAATMQNATGSLCLAGVRCVESLRQHVAFVCALIVFVLWCALPIKAYAVSFVGWSSSGGLSPVITLQFSNNVIGDAPDFTWFAGNASSISLVDESGSYVPLSVWHGYSGTPSSDSGFERQKIYCQPSVELVSGTSYTLIVGTIQSYNQPAFGGTSIEFTTPGEKPQPPETEEPGDSGDGGSHDGAGGGSDGAEDGDGAGDSGDEGGSGADDESDAGDANDENADGTIGASDTSSGESSSQTATFDGDEPTALSVERATPDAGEEDVADESSTTSSASLAAEPGGGVVYAIGEQPGGFGDDQSAQEDNEVEIPVWAGWSCALVALLLLAIGVLKRLAFWNWRLERTA